MDRGIIGHFDANAVSAANKGHKVYLFRGKTSVLQVVERCESPCRIWDSRPGANSCGSRAPQRTIWLHLHGRLTLPAREAWHIFCSAGQENSMLHKQLSGFPQWLPVWVWTEQHKNWAWYSVNVPFSKVTAKLPRKLYHPCENSSRSREKAIQW